MAGMIRPLWDTGNLCDPRPTHLAYTPLREREAVLACQGTGLRHLKATFLASYFSTVVNCVSCRRTHAFAMVQAMETALRSSPTSDKISIDWEKVYEFLDGMPDREREGK